MPDLGVPTQQARDIAAYLTATEERDVNDETTRATRRNGLTRETLLRRAGVAAGALGLVGLAGCGDSEEPGNGAALLSPDTDARSSDGRRRSGRRSTAAC